MDPISIGLGVVGLGLQLFGGMKQAENAKQQAGVSAQIAGEEQQVNDQKQLQMQMSASRQQLEIFRNTQKAQSMGLTAATSQNAQFGSGVEGGQAEAVAQGMFNSLGVSQNLEIGNRIAGIDRGISSNRIQLAQLGGNAATDQGLVSLGGSLLKAGPTLGALGKNVGAGFGSIGNNLFGGGSPSGYGQG